MIGDCLNNFTEETIENLFGNTEKVLKICEKCDNFICESGLITCKHLLEMFNLINDNN